MNNRMLRRVVVFVAIAAVSTATDLVTKYWASRSLARSDHPLSVHVSDADAGKSVAELLKAGPFQDVDPGRVVKLGPAVEAKGDELFPLEFITSHAGYWVFLDGERLEPPAFIPNPALKAYSARQKEGHSFESWKKEWVASSVKWSDVLSEGIPYLDEQESVALLEQGLVHAVAIRPASTGGALVVAAGDVLMVTERQVEVIPSLLRFIYAENPGAAWGILRDAPLLVRKVLLQLVSLIAMLVLLYVAYKAPEDQLASVVALALIFGGALGNFVDRIGRNFVVDFIDMYIKTAHWPTYNVADIAITFGVGIIAVQVLRKKSPF